MKHSQDDFADENNELAIITHVVDQNILGGEYTVCGRAITDSLLEIEGFERCGEDFEGTLKDCDCKDCRRRIRWFKALK
jgi:hypothetical protein